MLRRFPLHLCAAAGAAPGAEWYYSRKNQAREKKKKMGAEGYTPTESDGREQERAFAFPPSDDISIVTAYEIFGFTSADNITEEKIKKKYKILAKKHHPDKGGNPRDFQTLKEAHKLMMTVKHEPKGGKNKKENKFTKVTRAEALHRTDHTNMDENQWDVTDAFAVLIMVPLVVGFWYWHNMDVTLRLSDARRRMSVEEMRPQKREENAKDEWHPWRASNDDKEFITNLLEDRAKRNNVATSGYVEGSSPFEEQIKRANQNVEEFNEKHHRPERQAPPKLTIDNNNNNHETFGPTSMVGQISSEDKSPFSNNNNNKPSTVGTFSGASASRPHRSVFSG